MNLDNLLTFARSLDCHGIISIKKANRIALEKYRTLGKPHLVLVRFGYLNKCKNELTRTKMSYDELLERIQILLVCMDESTALFLLTSMSISQSSIILEVPEAQAERMRRSGTAAEVFA
jgi:hypothetical protein